MRVIYDGEIYEARNPKPAGAGIKYQCRFGFVYVAPEEAKAELVVADERLPDGTPCTHEVRRIHDRGEP